MSDVNTSRSESRKDETLDERIQSRPTRPRPRSPQRYRPIPSQRYRPYRCNRSPERRFSRPPNFPSSLNYGTPAKYRYKMRSYSYNKSHLKFKATQNDSKYRASKQLFNHHSSTSHTSWDETPKRISTASLSTITRLQYESLLASRTAIPSTSDLEPPERSRLTDTNVSEKPLDPEIVEPITVISVLRLVTALESMLDSLGPKVIELMMKALGMDKIKVNSSNQLLDVEDHYISFVTIQEKLKGKLNADLVEPNRVSVLKRTIENMTKLISDANIRRKTNTSPSIATTSCQIDRDFSQTVPTLMTKESDFNARLLTALHDHGITDVSPELLEQYADKYVKMANTKQRSVTTADQELDEVIFVSSSKTDVEDGGEITKPANDVNPETEVITSDTESDEVIFVSSSKLINTEQSMIQHSNEDMTSNISEPISPHTPFIAHSTQKNRKKGPSSSTYREDSPTFISDADLKELIKTFATLSDKEKHELIKYIKELEKNDPERMKRLGNSLIYVTKCSK